MAFFIAIADCAAFRLLPLRRETIRAEDGVLSGLSLAFLDFGALDEDPSSTIVCFGRRCAFFLYRTLEKAKRLPIIGSSAAPSLFARSP
jgi:hypothetical protein